MSLKLGYKQTEIGVIPDDWAPVKFGSICHRRRESGVPTAESFVIELEHIESGSGRLVGESSVQTMSSKRVFQEGDVLFGRLRSYLRKYLLAERDGFCSTEIWALVPENERVESGFLFQVVRLDGFITATGISYGTHMPRSDWSTIKEWPLSLPPPKEQKAIAEALSDVDALINSLEALLTKKRNIKTGVMQELLTGRTRLPGFTADWQEVRLGAICDFVPTIALSRAQLEADEGVMCIHYGDIHTKFSDRLDIANAMLPKSETLLVARVPRLKVGDLVLADASEDLVGVGKSVEIVSVGSVEVVGGLHTVVLRPKVGNFAPGFAGLLQHTPRFKEQSRVLAAGLKVYGLSKTSISKILVFVPPVKEQKAIAAVLSDIDDEIEALEKRLAKTRDLKQGMAQELLTGRMRLV